MTDQKGSDTLSPTTAPTEQGVAVTPAAAKKTAPKKAGAPKTAAKPRTTKKTTTEEAPAAPQKAPAKARTARADASLKEAKAPAKKASSAKAASAAPVESGAATAPPESAPSQKAPARKASARTPAAPKTTKSTSEAPAVNAAPRTEANTAPETPDAAAQSPVADKPKAKSAPRILTGTRSPIAKKTASPKGTAQKTLPSPLEEAPAAGIQAPRDTDFASPAEPDAVADTDSASSASSSRGRASASRGRGRGRPSRQDTRSTAPRTTESPAEFPTTFDDFSPEQASPHNEASLSADASLDDAPNADKKRRGRSRRGRGRRKSQDQPAMQDTANALDLEVTATEYLDDNEDDLPDQQDKGEDSLQKTTRRKMFVSVLPGEQVEVVLTEEGLVQEYYVEMLHQAKTKGNIYKATIHNVDPNLQAAFVSYGATKNGFLQIDEIHPEYYTVPHDGKGRKYPPIQKVLKSGQEILVQVVKEPAGTKGAFLTTYLSLPGRFLVLTPGREQIGVSRKVENETERSRLRQLLEGLNPGNGLGVIVRTVSMGASKTNLQNDLQYLQRTWRDVRTRGTEEETPSLIYQEMDLTTRAIRDYLTDEIVEVWLDDEETATSIAEVAEALFPRKNNLVRVHKDATATLFERFNLQRQLDQIQSREVVLPSGGRLVIDPTEALTAIDINSGRSGGKNNFEDMAYRTNLEAAKMIPLQLRLRDIGGQVVVDFIEMRDRGHWRELERTLRNGMKVDRARYDVGKISSFGMLEIVRQRLGSSAISISTEPCPYCKGTGVRRNIEWQSQQALREILRALNAAQAQNQTDVVYEAEPALAMHLLNNKRQRLLEMEQNHSITLEIHIKHPEVL